MLLGTCNSMALLVTALRRIDFTAEPRERLRLLLQTARIEFDELTPYVNFVDGRYTRNLVYRDDEFELLVLCWATGSGSPVHDHGGRQCYMTVHSGLLAVDDYVILSGGRRQGYAHIAPAGTTIMLPGAVDVRTSDRDLHRVTAAREPAISLHVYARPIDRFMIFSQAGRSCRTVFSRYDAVPELSAAGGLQPGG